VQAGAVEYEVNRPFWGFCVLLLTGGSPNKARKMGWHGFVDPTESFLEVFEDLAKLKMIPPVPKSKSNSIERRQ
jgi:hypothetical protein